MRNRRTLPVLILAWTALGAADPYSEGLARKQAGDLPAAQGAFQAAWAADPENLDALEQLATVTGWQGEHRRALELWDTLVARDPQRPSARLSRARVLYWLGRLDESRIALDDLDRTHPNDTDILELRGDVARAAGDRAGAESAYAAAGTSTALDKLARTRAEDAVRVRRWRLDLSGNLDRYVDTPEGGVARDNEHLLTMQVGRTLGTEAALSAGIEESLQFGETDHRLNVTGYWSPSLSDQHRLALDLRLAFTPDAEILADSEALLGVAATLTPDMAVVFSGYRRWYPGNQVDSLQAGVRLRFLTMVEVDARWVFGSSDLEPDTDAILIRAGLQGLGRWHPSLLYSDGEDNLPPTGVARTTTYGATVQVDLGDGYGLRADVGHETREDNPDRNSVALGWTLRW